MAWYNFWKLPVELIDDIRQWSTVRSALNEPQIKDQFSKFKYQLRVDKIGRIYTVINVPDDLLIYENRNMVWPWVLEELRSIDDLLMECRLNDLVYPEITPIEDAASYLVILTPSTESIDIWKFLRWILNTSIVFFILFIINRITIKASGLSMIDLFLSLF
jgi:hypothetical protein